ncbi:MAG: TrbI/VirB10 family protein [Alphaproteobacteria bacterium]|nr:TrbI/VirB10 family protein [Alphaproteobacteria bacterium]MBM3651904.1 TrbI/VirB10 family protein [Alphaproteobacteria bacterium]
MTDAQHETLPGERGITPVAGTEAEKKVSLQRGLGAAALTAFAMLIIWGTWKGEKPANDPAQKKLAIRQAAAFEPAKEPPKPSLTDVTGAIPHTAPAVLPAPVTDQLMESARRAPVLAYSKQGQMGRAARDQTGTVDPNAYALGLGEAQPRNELLDKLKPTSLDGVRAARLPNRNLIVTQGTSIPCVLETAMSSDVPGFVSCVVLRDVMSDSGNVVLMEKGTQIVGEYRGDLRRGSQRLFVLWTRAKTPTGVIVALSSPATDALGRAGFDGEVDNHFWQRFGAALLLSIAGDASAIGRQQLQNNEIQINNSTGAANNAAAIVVDRSINIPPTLTKNQGERVNVFVARDLDFSSVYKLRRIEPPRHSDSTPYAFEPTRALVTKP